MAVNGAHKKATSLQLQTEDDPPLFDAIANGQLQKLKSLYNSIHYTSLAASNAKTGAHISKLLLATLNGHAPVVHFLLTQKGDSIDLHRWNEDGQNPLIEAIKANRADIVTIMANHPDFFNQSFKDNEGNTPLHYVSAISNEQTRKTLAKILITAGMDIELKNNQNQQPQHYAEFAKIQQETKGHYPNKWAEALFVKPKSTKISDNWPSILGISIASGAMSFFSPVVAVISSFLASGYFLVCITYKQNIEKQKTHIQRKQLEADFAYQAIQGILNAENSKHFRNKGVDLNGLLAMDDRPLRLATESGNMALLQLLIENGAKPKQSTIYTAIKQHHLEATKLLLSQFKDVDLGNKNGFTPLMAAIIHGDEAIAKYLLANGAYTGKNDVAEQLIRFIRPVNPPTPQQPFLSSLTSPFTRPVANNTILDFAKLEVYRSTIAELIENANKKTASSPTTSKNVAVVHSFEKKRKSSEKKPEPKELEITNKKVRRKKM